MPRKCSGGIIAEFCKRCEKTEVPSLFAFWTGVFGVAECLGRDCFIDQGHYTVYPNMYVVLVAGSAKCRKSTSIELIRDFIKQVEPPIKMLSQKLTPEAMISALSGKVVKDKTQMVEEAVGCFINDELSTLIDKNTFASSLIPILTKLYDCKDFEYETKARGAEAVRNPCLSILGGSTIQWIREAIPPHAIGGGFTSRVVFVYRTQRERSIPWPIKTQEDVDREKRIIHDMNEIRQMRGPFGVSEEAIEIYSKEYDEFLNGPLTASPHLGGYVGRRHVTLLKTAMALSAAIKDTREIDAQDMYSAIQAIRVVEKSMDTVMRAITSEPCGDICEHVMTLIMTNGTILRSRLIYETRHRLTVRDLDAILQGLLESGYVQRCRHEGSEAYKYERKDD